MKQPFQKGGPGSYVQTVNNSVASKEHSADG